MDILSTRRIIPKAIFICLLLLFTNPLSAQKSNLTFHTDGKLATSSHDVYDNNGILRIRILYAYDEQGIVETRTIIGYDKSERQISTHTYTFDDELIWQESFKYDRKGNLVKRTQILYEGDLPIKNVYTYKYDYNWDGSWYRCRYFLNKKLYHTINH